MKRFISILACSIIVLTMCGCMVTPVTVAAYNVDSYTYDDIETLKELLEEQSSKMQAAKEMETAGRKLGYAESHDVIKLAREEYNEAYTMYLYYDRVLRDLKGRWHQKEVEYPAATYIWSYLKGLGYNNQVCAGILGNIMRECGGDTLDIQYGIRTDKYYGMCQWSKGYKDVWGASLEEQCAFLANTIQQELDVFGSLYKKGFNYDKFLRLTKTEEAALAFAKGYERCASGGYKTRQINAVNAYNYFVG